MHIFKRGFSAVLAAVLVVLTGCSGGKPASPADDAPGIQVAMGRYIEEEVSFPAEIENTAAIKRLDDGSIAALVSLTPDQIVGPWYLYSSVDDSKTWTKKDVPWLSQFDAATITAADFAPDGSLVFAAITYTEEMMAAMEKAVATQDFEAALAINPPYQYVSVTPEGEVSEFSVALPPDSSGRRGSPSDMKITQGGDVVISDYYTLFQFEIATGKQKNKFQLSGQPGAYLPCGDLLAAQDGSELLFFDLDTGEQTETVTLPAGDVRGNMAWDGTAVYYCGDSGIYRRVAGGAVLEQVVDGALTSLGMPALHCMALLPSQDKSFLAQFGAEGGLSMLRYRYSEELPTLPEKQLRVYSLSDDENIRQAMGLYQRSHPDTQVVFDVGIPVGSGILAADALRTLSTQLLAGQGPDILVLDGMPLESYLEKKILLELPESMTAGLLPNIVTASKEADGKLYALPARFLVPMALADSKAAESMTSLTALADYQSRRIKEMPTLSDNMDNPMQPHIQALISTFYPVSAPVWRKADGTLDNAAISSFLADLKKLTDTVPKETLQNAPMMAGDAGYDMAFGAAYWLYDHVPMVYGHSTEFFDLAPGEEAIAQKGGGRQFPLPGQAENVFIPKTLLGISAASRNTDAAKEFVSLLLSEQIQLCSFPGYPLSTAAFDKSAKNPFPPTDDGYTYGTVEADGSYQYLQVIWPDDAYMEQLKTMLKALNTSSRVDAVAIQMVTEETKSYFLNEKSLDDTVTALTEKLRLYYAE